MLIGICGLKGSGKNLTARLINQYSKLVFKERAFAYDLKKIASILIGIDAQTEEFKKLYLEDWNMTGRKFLCKLGTNVIRRYFNKKTFIYSLMKKYDKEKESVNWIITDVRFKNEVKAIKDREGIMIKVVKPDTYPNFFKRLFLHKSEKSLINYEADYILTANNEYELILQVKALCTHLKI